MGAAPLESVGQRRALTHSFDARPDVTAYRTHRLGPSARAKAYLPAAICLIFLALPVAFLILGIVMLGLPPLSVGVLGPFLVPIVLFGGMSAYYLRMAGSTSNAFPETYTVDAGGVNAQLPDGARKVIDWANPRIYVWMIDRRPWSDLTRGTTEIDVGGAGGLAYPVPPQMFDLVLHEARELGLAGDPESYRAARGGRVTRVIISGRNRGRRSA
jgi:hypothetical protein